jgi:hypothetical protein
MQTGHLRTNLRTCLAFLLLSLPLAAQVTAVKGPTVVTAHPGTLTCTFSSPSVPTPAGIAVSCADTAINYKESYNLPLPPVGNTNGAVGTITTPAGSVTWLFTLPTATTLNYQVAGTPTAGCPAGATCAASGQF